jgi:hypothetical protein
MRMTSTGQPPFLGLLAALAVGLALGAAGPSWAQQAADAPDAAPPAPLDSADPAEGADDQGGNESAEASSDPAAAQSDPAGAGDDGDDLYNSSSQDDDPLYNDADRYNPSLDERPTKGEGAKEQAAGKGAQGKQPADAGDAGADAADEPAGADAVRDTRPDEPYEPQGLGTAVTYPIQFCAGCLSVSVLTALLAPLSAVPFVGWILVPLVVWGATSTVMTTVGDGVGKNRGQIAWPWIAGMCVDMGCAGVSASILAAVVAGFSTVTGLGLTALLQVVDPTMIPTDAQSLQTYLIAAGAVLGLVGVVIGVLGLTLISGTRCASVNAAALTYTIASDTKEDDDFRFPGFFSANHGDDGGDEPQARSRDEGGEVDDGAYDEGDDQDGGYDDEGYEDGDDQGYEDDGDFAWFWGEVGVPGRNVGSISF